MSHPPSRPSFASRIGSFFSGRNKPVKKLFNTRDVIKQVKLDFPSLTLPELSIHWKENFNLQHLLNLPTNALSGPVQEHKAAAHSLLKHIVGKEEYNLNLFDMRDIYGINSNLEQALAYADFEGLCNSEMCKPIRIISMRDYNRVLDTAIPPARRKEIVQLYTAQWLGLNYFWACEQYAVEFSCAILYARRRGLALKMSTNVIQLVLNSEALVRLQKSYHMLVMPEDAWSNPGFMEYLVKYKTPYSRLKLQRGSNPIEVILLPREDYHSDALGSGLRLLGAQDATEFLLNLSRIDAHYSDEQD